MAGSWSSLAAPAGSSLACTWPKAKTGLPVWGPGLAPEVLPHLRGAKDLPPTARQRPEQRYRVTCAAPLRWVATRQQKLARLRKGSRRNWVATRQQGSQSDILAGRPDGRNGFAGDTSVPGSRHGQDRNRRRYARKTLSAVPATRGHAIAPKFGRSSALALAKRRYAS